MIEEIKHNNFQEVEKALLDLFETLSLIQARIQQCLERLAGGKKFKRKEPLEDPNTADLQPEVGPGFFSPV